MLRICVFVFCFVVYSSSLQAQEDTTKVIELERLVILSLEELLDVKVTTASKKEQKLVDAPSIISVFSRQDIERMGVTSLIDVLKYIPAIETSIGSDGDYRIDIRGSRKYGNILVLLNGQPFNNFYDGRSIFDFPVDVIEKIEVISGPGSALFGTNAVAGVLNIFTVKNKNSIIGGAGTNKTFSQNFNYTAKKEYREVSVTGGFLQSEGPNTLLESDAKSRQTWSLTYADKSAKTNRWVKDAYLGTQFKFKNLNINLFGINRNRGSWVGPVFILTPDSRLQSRQIVFDVSYSIKLDDRLSIIPKIYSHTIVNDFLFQEAPENYLSQTSGDLFKNGKITKEKYTALTFGSDIQLNLKINNAFDIIAGNIFENQSLPRYNLQRNYQIVGDVYKAEFGNYDNVPKDQKNKDRTILAEYFQGNYRFNKIEITAGLRFDSYSDFGQTLNPRAGIIFKPFNSLHFKGLYGKAFRAPTFKELYDNTTLGNEFGIRGNKDLKPETVNTMEFAVEFIKRRLAIKSSCFYILNFHLIEVYDPNGNGGIGQYQNIGNTKNIGYASEGIWTINKNFSLMGNFSQYFNKFEWDSLTAKKSDIVYFNKVSRCDKYLLNAPSIRINFSLNFAFSGFEGFIGGNYRYKAENNKRFYLEDDRFVQIPSNYQAHFSLAFKFKNNIKIRIAANNIGKKYSDPDESTNINVFGGKGMIQPKETYLLTLSYKF